MFYLITPHFVSRHLTCHFNFASMLISIVVFTILIPKCGWYVANTCCGVLWNMKKTATKLPLLLCNKVLPFLVFCGGSSFKSICGHLLWHFVNNVHAKAFSLLSTMRQNNNEKDFFWWDLCLLYWVECAMDICICSSFGSQW